MRTELIKTTQKKLSKAGSLTYWWIWRALGSRLGHALHKDPTLVFIASPPRSGSSLLATLITTHLHLVRWGGRGRLWGDDYHNVTLPTELDAQDLTPKDRCRIWNTLSFFQYFHPVPILIKQVHSTLKLNALIDIFPNMRLVILYRDGRASIESLLRTIQRDTKRQQDPFGKYGRPRDFQDWLEADWLDKMCYLWRTYIRSMQDAVRRLPSGNHVQVLYEDLCQSPQSEIRRIQEFLELDVTRQNWNLIPSELANQNWKFHENLSDAQQERIEEHIQDILAELGYSDVCK